jgi:hypothetical protein
MRVPKLTQCTIYAHYNIECIGTSYNILCVIIFLGPEIVLPGNVIW